MVQVFLGGTAGANRWRTEVFIPYLVEHGVRPELLFNPVVSNWDEAAQAREDAVKAQAPYLVFVIANPLTPGNEVSAYSLVEAVMALYDKPARTVVVLDASGLSSHVAKAMTKTFGDLRQRFPKAPIFDSLREAADWLIERLKT